MPLSSLGQAIMFEKVYGGSGKDLPFDVLQTRDRGYLVGGGSANYSSNDGQAFLYRFDTLGDPLWDKGYGGEGTERFRDIAYSADSSFVAAGISNSTPSGDYQFYLVKTDSSGNKIWSERYGGSDWEELNALEALPDSSYLLGGLSYSTDSGDADLFLLKVDHQGDSLWSRTYGGTGFDELNDVIRSDTGDLILVGERTDSSGADTSRAYMIRTDSMGVPKWDSTYTFGVRSFFSSAIEKGNGDIVGPVNYRDSSGGDMDLSLLRTTPNGSVVWSRSAGGNELNLFWDISSTTDGGQVFAGYKRGAGVGKEDIWLFKTGSNGYFDWGGSYGGLDSERTYCVELTNDSGFVTAGITESYGESESNIYLLKTDSSGTSTGNVIVDLDAGKENKAPSPTNPSLYPNPVKRGQQVVLRYKKIKGIEKAHIEIRSLKGKIVQTFTREQSGRSTFNSSELRSGAYLLILEREDLPPLEKMLIIR